jgi:hypothetical protein
MQPTVMSEAGARGGYQPQHAAQVHTRPGRLRGRIRPGPAEVLLPAGLGRSERQPQPDAGSSEDLLGRGSCPAKVGAVGPGSLGVDWRNREDRQLKVRRPAAAPGPTPHTMIDSDTHDPNPNRPRIKAKSMTQSTTVRVGVHGAETRISELQTALERLGAATLRILEDENNDLLLSPASAWEIAIKYRLGKLVARATGAPGDSARAVVNG